MRVRLLRRRVVAGLALGLSVLVGFGMPLGDASLASPAVAAPLQPDTDAESGDAGGGAPNEGGEDITPSPGDTGSESDPGGAGSDSENTPQDQQQSTTEGVEAETADDSGISPLSVEVEDGDDYYHMPDPGRPYLKFEISDPATNEPIEHPGSTVTIQGPRDVTGWIVYSVNWGSPVVVTDCVTEAEPCGYNSLDQDSRPGHFAVDRLTSGQNAPALDSTKRYRIGAGPNQYTSAPVGYQWKTAALTGTAWNAANVTAVIPSDGYAENSTDQQSNNAASGQWVSIQNPGYPGDPSKSNMVHDFYRTQANAGPPELSPAPYLTWQVTQNGTHVGGATVRVQGPRTGASAYGISYDVPDCTSAPEPCAADSMDQDPAPGKFTVYNFRAATGGAAAVDGIGRYRIQLANSTAPLNLQWVNASGVYLQPGSNNTSGTWSTDGNGAKYYDFSASPGTPGAPFAVQTAPSIVWSVTKDDVPTGGATVQVQVSTSSTNNPSGTIYDVVDCTSDPCAPNSLDQNPGIGQFRVYNLTGSLPVAENRRYWIRPSASGAPTNTAWITSSSAWSAASGSNGGGWTTNPPQYEFAALTLQEAPSLVWEVRHQTTGDVVGGATVKVRGPRVSSTSWTTEYRVQDCTTAPDPCPGISMDQDPNPGKFQVFTLRIGSTEGFVSHSVSRSSRYGIQPFISPIGSQWVTDPTTWIDIPGGSSNSPTGWNQQRWTFGNPLLVKDGAFLEWTVKDENGAPVTGATVELQGPRSGAVAEDPARWGSSYYITDCAENPCHPDSMDQDPRPGVFQVDTLRGLNGTTQTAVDVDRKRYRIRPIGSIPGYTWRTSTTAWDAIPAESGAGNHNNPNPDNWPTSSLGYTFDDLHVQSGRAASDFCSAPTDGRYYTLARESSGSAETTIRQLAPNGTETAITNTNNLVANSTNTLVGAGQTANSLGITPSGVFYFTGQYASGTNEQARNVTIYRFDPKVDAAPYPVANMDMLSPATGTIVSGDAMIYQGREEFYFAYYSDAPAGTNIDGRLAIRFHLYRFSMGNGDRTGEVRHIDVPRSANFGSGFNGDFAFDAQNNMQFIISSSSGRISSGVVNASDFVPQPSAHVLSDVTAIQGSANLLDSQNTNLASINGIAYTKNGRALLQRNAGTNNNFLADMPSFSNMSTQQTFASSGYFVDLAGCDSPTTISVKKEVVGPRYNANDQFTLNADRQVGSQTPEQFTPATTTGNNEGVQTEMVGPFVTTLQGTFHASEEFTQNDDRYETAWECSVGGSAPFLTSGGYAPDAANRSLSFSLENNPAIQAGDQVECVFKNRRYAADLKVSKTSEPVTGTSMAPGETIRYILTFDNTTGSAPARDINYIDWLRDVLDDADLEAFTDGHYFEYRNSAGDPWSATPADTQNQIVAQVVAPDIATSQQISITGQVPSHGVRQVSFQVKVKANSADRGTPAAPLQSYLLRNYLTPATTTEPPATCEIPAAPGLPLCAEHPVDAWTMQKYSQPGDGAAIHSGGNIYYRVKVTNFSGHDLNDVVIHDNMTQTLAASVLDFTASGLVPQPWGISFYRANGTRITSAQESGITAYEQVWTQVNGGTNQPTMTYTAGGTGSCVLDNEWPTAGQSKPVSAHGCWQFSTPEFDVPHKVGNTEIAYAEIGYVVRGGAAAQANQPTVPVVPVNNDAVIPNQRWINTVQAGQAKLAEVGVWPNECSAEGSGVPTGAVDADSPYNVCKTEHSLGESYFHIWKKFGPVTPNTNNNLLGAEFVLADTEQDARNGVSSRWLCRVNNNPWSVGDNLPPGITARPSGATYTTPGSDPSSSGDEDFGATSPTHAAIVKWNELVAQGDETYLPSGATEVDVCGQFFRLDASNLQGQPEGAWRAVDVRGGDTDGTGGPLPNWRTESAFNDANDEDQGRHGTYWLVERKAPNGYELLAQPMKMWVAPAALTPDGTTAGTQAWYDYQGRLSLPVVGVNEIAPILPSGHIMPEPDGVDNQNIRISCANPWELPGNNQPNCVMPTGWTMPVFDVQARALPLTGGQLLGVLTVGGALVLLLAFGGTIWWRRRQAASSAPGTEPTVSSGVSL